MVKNDFIKKVSESANKTQKEVKEFLDLIDKTIIEVLQNEDEVKLGLCTIRKEFKPERECRNPATGEQMIAPAKNTVKVKVLKRLKDAVNQ